MLELTEKRKFLINYYTLLFLRGFVFLKNFLIILLDNNLNPIEVGAVLSSGIITSVILSLPISTLSSKFGNKKIYILGVLIFLMSYISLIFKTNFYTFIFYSIGDAIFDIVSFSSRESLIYCNIKHHNLTSSFAEYKSMSKFFKLAAATISTFFAGDLIYISPRAVFSIDILILILTIFTILKMQDCSYGNNDHKIKIKKAFKYVFRHTSLLKCFLHRVIWYSIFLLITTYRSFYYEELAINDRNINLMVSFQIFLVTILQVFLVKKLSKKNMFLGYLMFIISSLFMLISFINYHGLYSYFFMIGYFITIEVAGDLTYPNLLSFIPRKEMPIILSAINLMSNGAKLIFLNIFTITASIYGYKTAFTTLSLIFLILITIITYLICTDKHLKNIHYKRTLVN